MTAPAQFEQPTDSDQSTAPAMGDEAPPEMEPAPGEIRSQLLEGVVEAQDQPDLAQQVYASMGFSVAGISIRGSRSLMSDIEPGDLVGWVGAQEPDGRYVGQIAIYAGNREIIEPYYGTVRRRPLNPDDNTFGMPVNRPGNPELPVSDAL